MALSRLPSGFSWADEVEEEERKLEKEKQKSSKRQNPFGFVRPRGKVVEEKGIDWRRFDELLNYSSRKEKKLKENIPATTVLTERKEHSPPKFRFPRQIPPRTKNGRNVPEHPVQTSVSCRLKDQDLSALVPPLMYPPRNITALMVEMQNPHEPNCYRSRRQLNEHNMELDRVKGNFADSNSRIAAGLNSSIENTNRPYLDNMKAMRMTPQRRRSLADNEFQRRRSLNKVDMNREVERSYRKRGVNNLRLGGPGPERNFPVEFRRKDYMKRGGVSTPEASNYNRQRR